MIISQLKVLCNIGGIRINFDANFFNIAQLIIFIIEFWGFPALQTQFATHWSIIESTSTTLSSCWICFAIDIFFAVFALNAFSFYSPPFAPSAIFSTKTRHIWKQNFRNPWRMPSKVPSECQNWIQKRYESYNWKMEALLSKKKTWFVGPIFYWPSIRNLKFI